MKVALDLSSAKETPNQTNHKLFGHICKVPHVSIDHLESVEGVQDSMYQDRNEKIGAFFFKAGGVFSYWQATLFFIGYY